MGAPEAHLTGGDPGRALCGDATDTQAAVFGDAAAARDAGYAVCDDCLALARDATGHRRADLHTSAAAVRATSQLVIDRSMAARAAVADTRAAIDALLERVRDLAPLRAPQPTAAAEPPPAPSPPEPTILLVEDDEDLRVELAAILAHEGFAIAEAANGREALERLASATVLPDVILLDLMMPEMNGWEFRERQLADPRLRDVPLLVMSAGLVRPPPPGALAADAFFGKPLRVESLLEALRARTGRGP